MVVCGYQAWLREQIPKIRVFKRDWTTCLKTIAILSSIVDITSKGLNEHFVEHENLHFDNEEDIHVYELQKLRGKRLQPRFGFASLRSCTKMTCFIS